MCIFDEADVRMISTVRRIFYMQSWETSQLGVVTSVVDDADAKMISTPRRIFCIEDLRPSKPRQCSICAFRVPQGYFSPVSFEGHSPHE